LTPYYEHAGITIYHGDCREILPTLPRCDLLLTDPPYGIGWSRGLNNQRASKAHPGIVNDEDTSCRDEALEILGDIPGVVFGSFYAAYPSRLKQVLVWRKPSDTGIVGCVTGFRRDAEPIFLVGSWPLRTAFRSSVIESWRGNRSYTTGDHPHAKPLELLTEILMLSVEGSVIDPFMGSGTTLVAAKNLGRKAIGIEIEERYCEIAAKRLSQEVLDFSESKIAAQ
jgi:DNA modification methylase